MNRKIDIMPAAMAGRDRISALTLFQRTVAEVIIIDMIEG